MPGPAQTFTGVFETHLNVADLERSIRFYQETLGLELGLSQPERCLALFWVGGRGQGMLGLWEKPREEIQRQHFAFRVPLERLSEVTRLLREAGIATRDFVGREGTAPTVFGWMPAASLYFDDPDGHLLEVIAMLPGDPRPALGVPTLLEWQAETGSAQDG